MRPVFDQYGLGRSQQRARPTCSVFTVVGALEFAVAKRQGQTPRLSVEFLNWAGNKACGEQADGGFFSDLWKGYEAYGICTAADYPYAAKFDPAGSPPAEALADAKTRLGLGLRINWIKEWNVNTGLTESQVAGIKRALADGWPVCAGCRWPKQEKWVEGVLQMCPADAVRDGHSVLLVGYREDAAQPGAGVFIFRNTAGVGKDGFMPYEYARAYVNDALWIDFAPRSKQTGAVAPRAVFDRDALLPAEGGPVGFSTAHMDASVSPGTDFYRYADGGWVKQNPVPADKSRWGAFMELQEQNWAHIHEILDSTCNAAVRNNSPAQKVADFFRSAMDTNQLEQLGFKPLAADLQAIDAVKNPASLMRLLARFHERGIAAGFGRSASPDARNSGSYAFYVSQGGLGLPDRDYYLSDRFAKQKEAYQAHIARMLTLLGDEPATAAKEAEQILALETSLARNSKSRVDLRDPIANYHKFPVAQVLKEHPDLALDNYLAESGLRDLPQVIVRQTEFFDFLGHSLKEVPLAEWKTYLRWHLLRATAPYLHSAAEAADFEFYGRVLREQQVQEPPWQRAARMVDGEIGEALGQLFVERYFPPAARARMQELVENVKAVFRERLQKLDWMTAATRTKALAKFDRFTQKIGYPDKFRDYSSVGIRPDDLLGNVQRAEAFETRRQLSRVGKPVDRTEWRMTPQTVNAYFSPPLNEIVFPAGILQPPFFDLEMDDAVNYGGIGVVIGHEITHGYDDQGRKYDADGNLNDWWTEQDAKAFTERSKKIVAQYNAYEPLPGLHVNGELTLGENIADLGGTSIAYEALQRALAREPTKRKKIDGFTPEQRFFLSLSQIWRANCREAEARRLVTVDPHSPGQFRAVGPHVNLQEFYDAFGIREGAPMWRGPELRAKIW